MSPTPVRNAFLVQSGSQRKYYTNTRRCASTEFPKRLAFLAFVEIIIRFQHRLDWTNRAGRRQRRRRAIWVLLEICDTWMIIKIERYYCFNWWLLAASWPPMILLYNKSNKRTHDTDIRNSLAYVYDVFWAPKSAAREKRNIIISTWVKKVLTNNHVGIEQYIISTRRCYCVKGRRRTDHFNLERIGVWGWVDKSLIQHSLVSMFFGDLRAFGVVRNSCVWIYRIIDSEEQMIEIFLCFSNT